MVGASMGGIYVRLYQAQYPDEVVGFVFVDPAHDDFHLKPDSPALRLGFKPFDYTQAGRTTPPTLTKDLPRVPAAFEASMPPK